MKGNYNVVNLATVSTYCLDLKSDDFLWYLNACSEQHYVTMLRQHTSAKQLRLIGLRMCTRKFFRYFFSFGGPENYQHLLLTSNGIEELPRLDRDAVTLAQRFLEDATQMTRDETSRALWHLTCRAPWEIYDTPTSIDLVGIQLPDMVTSMNIHC